MPLLPSIKQSKSWCCHWCLKYSSFAFKWHRWHRCSFHLSFDHAIGFCFTQFTQQALMEAISAVQSSTLHSTHSAHMPISTWNAGSFDSLQRWCASERNTRVQQFFSMMPMFVVCRRQSSACCNRRSRYLDSKLHIKCTSIFASIHSEKFYAYWVLPFCVSQGSDKTAAKEVFALTEQNSISFVADLEINFKHLQTFWRFLSEWKRATARFDLKTRIVMPQFEHFLCDPVKSERWPWLVQSAISFLVE